ncbi:MAG: phosphocholine cytidylyltransferase family protein [Parasporobacterium sp.]|nr:phosphocholine cytidylyltransferase family protein [Parasporobacterium sp.]
MKAILLAAGVGTRIINDIDRQPKSMLDVGGMPLIVHTVELLQKNNMDVVIITGFMNEVIEKALKGYDVTFYYNPFYAVTNSIGSLWFAREEFNTDEIFVANADVYYTQELLDIIINEKKDIFLLSDRTRVDEGDYFFMTRDGILEKFGKELTRKERNCEYVGIGVIKNDWVPLFKNRLCDMINSGQYNLWWENVLYSFVGERPVYTVDSEGCFWSEVDTIEDYKRVVDFCSR